MNNPIPEIAAKIERAMQSVVFGAVAGGACVAALFFFSIAAFVAVRASYGTVPAALTLGCAYLVLALAAVIAVALLRRKAPPPPPPPAAPKAPQAWWQDPMVMTAGLEVLRTLGPKRVAGLAVAGAMIAGILLGGRRRKPDPPPPPSA